jgi:Saposin-like type B, region 1
MSKTLLVISILGDNYKLIRKDNMLVESKRSSQWCQICENFATDALSYLDKNLTETEVITFLHQDCAKLDNFEEEVRGKILSVLVDPFHYSIYNCLLSKYFG